MIPTDANIGEMKFHGATRRGWLFMFPRRAIVCYSRVELTLSRCSKLVRPYRRLGVDILELFTDQEQIYRVSPALASEHKCRLGSFP